MAKGKRQKVIRSGFRRYFWFCQVAEEMICPYGEDDDDFELNCGSSMRGLFWRMDFVFLGVIDRNFQVAYTMVDEMHRQHPRVVRDAFWDQIDIEIPYTAAAYAFRTVPHLGSTLTMKYGVKVFCFCYVILRKLHTYS